MTRLRRSVLRKAEPAPLAPVPAAPASPSRLACIVIAHERRRALVYERVLPSLTAQSTPFDEILLVGDWYQDATYAPDNFRYLYVPAITHSTIDALAKRDAATLATRSDVLCYLADDHVLGPNFVAGVHAALDDPWDVIVPNRWGVRDGARTQLNNGERGTYCGGHAGVFRRWLIERRPWLTMPHHMFWDLLASVEQQRTLGARFVCGPRAEIAVEDIEPGAAPWT